MILSSTVLAILFFVTANADAQRCNRWNTCYEQMQQQENVMSINRKIELLEQEKSNGFI